MPAVIDNLGELYIQLHNTKKRLKSLVHPYVNRFLSHSDQFSSASMVVVLGVKTAKDK